MAAEERAATEARAAEIQASEEAKRDALSDEELLAELDLPDPETLKPGDDVSAFMAKAVPDRLRRRALRQLWRLNPILANVDGLVDYGEDFTDGALVVENLQTAYQVGRGMLKHIAEIEKSAEAEDLPEGPEPAVASEETLTQADAPESAETPVPPPSPVTDEAPAAPLSRRRMVFAVEHDPVAPAETERL